MRARSASLLIAIVLPLAVLAAALAHQGAIAAQTGVAILHSSTYQDELGRVILVGELRNDGDEDISLVMLTATFFDAAGAVLDRADGIALISQVQPGETAPFVVDTRSAAAAGYDRYEIAESHYDGGFGPVVRDLEVSIEWTTTGPDGALHIEAQVINTTGRPVRVTDVVIALCDEVGTILRAEVGAVYETLSPGQSAAFAVAFAAPPAYGGYRTWVSARPAP